MCTRDGVPPSYRIAAHRSAEVFSAAIVAGSGSSAIAGTPHESPTTAILTLNIITDRFIHAMWDSQQMPALVIPYSLHPQLGRPGEFPNGNGSIVEARRDRI